MKNYDWEAGIAPVFMQEVDDINDKMPDNFPYEVIGVAVANTQTGEAAFLTYMPETGHIIEADCLKDLLGDVDHAYHACLKMRAAKK